MGCSPFRATAGIRRWVRSSAGRVRSKGVRVAGGVVAPVGVEVSVGDDGTQSQYGFRSVKAPAGAGDVEVVGDQVPAGALDRAGGDRPAVFQRRVVAELIEVAGQVAVAGVDSLAPGSRQVFPLGLAGHFRGGAGSLTCEDRGKTVGGPCFGPGQEAGGAGGPVYVLGRTALGGDAAAPELQVQVLNVQGQEFLGSGRCFVERSPEDPFAQAVPVVGEQLVQPGARDRAVAAAGGFAPLQSASRIGGEDLLPSGPGGERGQRGQVRFQVAAAAASHRSITAA